MMPLSENSAAPFQLHAQGAARSPNSSAKSSAGKAMLTARTTKKPASSGMRASA